MQLLFTGSIALLALLLPGGFIALGIFYSIKEWRGKKSLLDKVKVGEESMKKHIQLLNQIRVINEEVTKLESIAYHHLIIRNNIQIQLAEAEGYRFALFSNRFDSPKGDCPLSESDELLLRKKCAKATAAYKKALVPLGKKQRQLNRLISRVNIVQLAEDLNVFLVNIGEGLAGHWSEK